MTIAIDLGTSTTHVAYVENRKPAVVPPGMIWAPEGARGTPAVVTITDAGALVVGRDAERQLVNRPACTVAGVKRLLGLPADAPAAGHLVASAGLELSTAADGIVQVHVGGRMYGGAELCAPLLAAMKAEAQPYLPTPIEDAVLVVPAGIGVPPQQAYAEAARLAGLRVAATVSEPVAVLLAYASARPARARRQRVAVCHLGAGTFHVAVAALGKDRVELQALRGHAALGGADLDARVVDWIVAQTRAARDADLTSDFAAMRRLWVAAARTRHDLSLRASADISLPFLTSGPQGPVHVELTLTRTQLEELTGELTDATLAHCRDTLVEAGRGTLDALLLVGGVTAMPRIREQVTALFGIEPVAGFEASEAAVRGAAVVAGGLAGTMTPITVAGVGPG